MKDDVSLKGMRLVEELGEDVALSSKWMAFYIAELMERAEKGDEQTRRQASDLCAELIVKLWNIRLQSKIVEVEHGLQSWLKRKKSYDADERYEKLKDALADPDSVGDKIDANTPLDLRTLRDIEDDVIKVWSVAEAAANAEEKLVEEIAQEFSKSDNEILTVQERLAKVFPAFVNLSLTELDTVRRHAVDALRSVEAARCALLWSKAETEDQETTDDTAPEN